MKECRVWLALMAAITVVLTARALAPSDLHERDQPKTAAYTADIVINSRWVLPRDPEGEPATKPPMFNWIGAGVIKATGRFDEWALRAPSVLAGLTVLAISAAMAGFLTRRADAVSDTGRDLRPLTGAVGALTAMIWLANHANVRAIYEARPDMVMTAFLTGAWALATLLMNSQTTRDQSCLKRIIMALGLWLCMAAAALTKGPAAFLMVIYIPLSAWLIHRSRAAFWSTGFIWGLPLTLALVGWWLYGAWLADPQHFQHRLIGYEIVDRVTAREGEWTWLKQLLMFWKTPLYFLTSFAPWSVLVVLALWDIRVGRWRRHPLAPAILWVLLVIVFFSVAGNKKALYLLPAYGPAAMIAAYWLFFIERVVRLKPTPACLIAFVVAMVFASLTYFRPRFGETGYGENVRRFAVQAQQLVGDQPVVFVNNGYTPLQTLMGRHQGESFPSPQQIQQAQWLIQPYGELPPHLHLSESQQRMLPNRVDHPALISGPVTGLLDAAAAPLAIYKIER